MSKSPFVLLESQVVYSNPWVRVTEDSVIRPDGEHGTFGIVTMKEGSTVLPVHDNGDVTLVREYKYGVARYSLELMSGAIDEGESALEAAKRELGEELGFAASNWRYFGYVDPFTTIVKSPNHMFVATGISKLSLPADPGEIVDPVRLPGAKAVEMVMGGEITHSASCVLLLKAARQLQW